ncbi:Rrp15p-domain-containing protein [Parathielavia appendiculata]|uniref:Rrp15p-domain-containing protein n=1 Tax=Parathielavia appendiculata TaxID=2587402 RepID=A0AAN6TYH7_9PEZI|nr:Rrp15p-domain-containing protein [Parathielavia appendiculata]
MSGTSTKKRSLNNGPKDKAARPTKKQRQMAAYHSSSEESASDNEDAPVPANLLDSDDEDLDNIEVDDGASSEGSPSDSDSHFEAESTSRRQPAPKPKQPTKKSFVAKDAPDSDTASSDEEANVDSADDHQHDSFSDAASHSDSAQGSSRPKSKRNDPAAFATSISKMLSSKLPVSRRADPIVARSGAAAEHARQAVDAALEAKARKRLREQKRLAMEKGRVRDVLVASKTRTLNVVTGEIEEVPDEKGAQTTEEILAAERRLRKVAQRGVVKLFNAVRAAQAKAAEAERLARREGVVGSKRKEEKVTEMSRKGFLDLIASGGGGLKKGGLEEA